MKGFLIFILSLFSLASLSQDVLRGEIVDESFQPIPFANVYVKGNADLRVQADIDGLYLMRLMPGDYRLVFTATGYEEKELFVVVRRGENVKNAQLFPLAVQDLEEIEISTKKRNPGRDIILNVVRKKDSLDQNQFQHKCNVYIKATEKIERLKKEDKKEENKDTLKEKEEKLLGNFNLIEVNIERNYAPVNNVREIRNAFSQRGSKRNHLYFTTTAKSNFNFFKNTLYLDDLNASPIPSPISTIGILSYKYKLVEQTEVNGVKTHKIEIKARSSATSTLSGFIWVQDKTWMVEKLELALEKGNLFIYDYFKITQEFDISSDSLCVLQNQIMEYGVEYSSAKHTCRTVAKYDQYNFNIEYPKKYFGNEVAVTTEEAYEKDSLYWHNSRTEPLTEEEKEFIRRRDSLYNIRTSKVYLDSIDSLVNKVTFGKVAIFGVYHRNREKKYQWVIDPLVSLLQPVYIAGPRLSPGFSYFKKWEDERNIRTYIKPSYGLLNKDLKGTASIWHQYAPFKMGNLGVRVNHDFSVIRSYDAFTQILLRDNFIEVSTLSLYHGYELFNGFYTNAQFDYTERRSLYENTKFITWFDEALGNEDPPEFETYQAMIAKLTISYTPFQKYMREPHRKVVLGSKWPTVFAYYEKGIPSLFGSDVNHDYLLLGINQTFKISTFGTSKYRLTSGRFLNAKVLREVDYKYHRRSDPIWFSNPMYSYQDIDTSLPTLDWYFESHFIHHFNGALINKIPFMKKTRITSVVGGGYLYVPEHKWQHYEAYAGLERVFKLGRQRLRLGLYGVVSDGNNIKPRTTYKVSFAFLDPDDMTFWF